MLDFEKLMIPVWASDIIYDESVLFVREDDNSLSAPLLFTPEEIISVTTADKTEDFHEGQDWVLKDGKIHLTPLSRIFYFEKDELYPNIGIKGHSFKISNGKSLLFNEGHFFHDRQVAVTYKKKSQWTGHLPAYSGEVLPLTIQKLKDKEKLNLVLFGDSISEGANASKVMGAEPFLPSWGELLCENLNTKTGADVNFFNPSRGGMNSVWGYENADELVNCCSPDLVIIAFGANDVKRELNEFAENIQKIIDTVREKNPECEFILVATSLPNKLLSEGGDCFYYNQPQHKKYLARLCGNGVALANITDMQSYLYEHKRFFDTTGNNVNHPNDFFHRLYAQYVSDMLIQGGYNK